MFDAICLFLNTVMGTPRYVVRIYDIARKSQKTENYHVWEGQRKVLLFPPKIRNRFLDFVEIHAWEIHVWESIYPTTDGAVSLRKRPWKVHARFASDTGGHMLALQATMDGALSLYRQHGRAHGPLENGNG